MKKITKPFLLLLVLLLNSCAGFNHDPPMLPFHMVSSVQADNKSTPTVIFVHGGNFSWVSLMLKIPDARVLEFNYSFLDGTEKNGRRFLKEFTKFRGKNQYSPIVIVGYCYGGSVVASAIESASESEATIFKDTSFVLLAPVAFAGSDWAVGASDFFPQLIMKSLPVITLFMAPDFSRIAYSEDPEGPVTQGLVGKLPLLKKRVRNFAVIVEEKDYASNKHIPKKNPDGTYDFPNFKRNYDAVMQDAIIIPRPAQYEKTKEEEADPHIKILTDKNVKKIIEDLLKTEGVSFSQKTTHRSVGSMGFLTLGNTSQKKQPINQAAFVFSKIFFPTSPSSV